MLRFACAPLVFKEQFIAHLNRNNYNSIGILMSRHNDVSFAKKKCKMHFHVHIARKTNNTTTTIKWHRQHLAYFAIARFFYSLVIDKNKMKKARETETESDLNFNLFFSFVHIFLAFIALVLSFFAIISDDFSLSLSQHEAKVLLSISEWRMILLMLCAETT